MLKEDTKALLKGAYKTGIAAVLTLYISNSSDSTYKLYSMEWFRHFYFQCLVVVLGMEARYWLKWANGGNGVIKNDETKSP